MKERLTRLQTIKEIIKEKRIASQESLLEYLQEKEFTVTQATLSRDLKFLKVGKIPDGKDGFYYQLPEAEAGKETEAGFYGDIERGIIGISFSGNLGIVYTMPGHANSVAFALDNLELPEILGTIAGDDTILLILRENAVRDNLTGTLRKKIPQLEIRE